MDRYIFPAIFEKCEEGGYTVTFPDLPGCITEGDDMPEALSMAKEALELHLYYMEKSGDIIPEPSDPEDIKPDNGFITIIEASMVVARDRISNKAIRKTLCVPQWLDDIAKEKKVNFSQILQAGLKNYLGVSELRKGK